MEETKKGEGQPNASFEALKAEHAKIQEQTAGTFTEGNQDESAGNGEDESNDAELQAKKEAEEAEARKRAEEEDAAKAEEEARAKGKQDDNGEEDAEQDPQEDPNIEVPKDRKVIPIKLLHDEKRKRQEVEAEKVRLEKEVADLQAIANKTSQGSVKQAEAIKSWAEKNGQDVEEIEELVGIIRASSEVNQETILKNVFGEGADLDTIREAVKIAKETKMNAVFDTEFQQVLPNIRAAYPNATEEQIRQARKTIDDISHSEWGHDKDLDYILFKKKDELDKVFKTTGEVKKAVKGPETSRFGQGAPRGLTAKDFSGKNAKPFTELAALPEADRQKIVSEMDVFTKQAYWTATGGTMGDTLKRGGKKVGEI